MPTRREQQVAAFFARERIMAAAEQARERQVREYLAAEQFTASASTTCGHVWHYESDGSGATCLRCGLFDPDRPF